MRTAFLFLFMISSITAQNLLPLNIGNKWFYEDEYKDTYVVQIDTVVNFNGIEYYNCSKSQKMTDILFRMCDNGFYETVSLLDSISFYYYMKDAKRGDIWNLPDIFELPDFTPYIEVSDTFSANVFGQNVTIKLLYKDGGVVAWSQYWTDEFGLLSSNEVPFNNTVYRLKGCIIDGVVYGDTSLLSGVEDTYIDLNTDYELFQNYPNPFNPTTKIFYSISERSKVILCVYDITGSLVKTLVNEEQYPGKYQSTFDGTDLASGVYFYRLSILGQNGQILNKCAKMIFMK